MSIFFFANLIPHNLRLATGIPKSVVVDVYMDDGNVNLPHRDVWNILYDINILQTNMPVTWTSMNKSHSTSLVYNSFQEMHQTPILLWNKRIWNNQANQRENLFL